MFVKVNSAKFDEGSVVIWDGSREHVLEFPELWEKFNGAFIVAKGKDDETVYQVSDTPLINAAIGRGDLVKSNSPIVEKIVPTETDPEKAPKSKRG